jgi:hypothetical protein
MRLALESSNIPSIVIKGEKQMQQESEQRAQQQQAQNAQEGILLTGLSNVTSYSSSTPYGKGGNTPAFFKIDSSLTIKGLSA